MVTGTVKWFNDAKGFGFIVQDNGGPDVFCHHTAIVADGFRTLAEGQKVQFEVNKGPKGLQAANIRPLAYAIFRTQSAKGRVRKDRALSFFLQPVLLHLHREAAKSAKVWLVGAGATSEVAPHQQQKTSRS